jgi:hypothetical protein
MRRFKALLICACSGAVLTTNAARAAERTLYCTPTETRIAPDRLVSVEIGLGADSSIKSVLYRAANGAAYDRSRQYDARSHRGSWPPQWSGRLRANPNLLMVGGLYDQGGRVVYGEIIYDAVLGNKPVTVIQSDCGKTLGTGGESSPKGDLSFADKTALSDYTDCRIKAATAMALASNESAATISDAASGVCLKQRQAVVAAAGANGFDVADALDREFRPSLLALVIEARAGAHATNPAPGEQSVKEYRY